MYKLDKIKSLFDCDTCNSLLVDPITLPCGNNVCHKHLDKLVPKAGFICERCHGNHTVPEEGFKVNKQIRKALDIEFSNLEVSFASYDHCKTKLEEARKSVAEIKALEENPDSYIHEYFSNIKIQVDIRREDLKFKIDKCSDDIIQYVENAQSELIRLSKEVNETSIHIEKYKR